jgi:hypothetical protein
MKTKSKIERLCFTIELCIIGILNNPNRLALVAKYNRSFESLDDIMNKEENKFLNVDDLKISDYMKDVLKSQYQSCHYKNLKFNF